MNPHLMTCVRLITAFKGKKDNLPKDSWRQKSDGEALVKGRLGTAMIMTAMMKVT